MDSDFGTDKIFEVVRTMEMAGAEFYRQAAEKTSNEDVKQVLLDLAAMEDGHLKLFEQMRKELGGDEALSADDNQGSQYLKGMLEGPGGEGIKNPLEKLSGDETIKEILEIAIEGENAAILFYTGLKELVAKKADKEKIEAVIREELGHAVALSMNLTVLG